MAEVKTHTFSGRKFRVEQVVRIDGVTDTDELPDLNLPLDMCILRGNGIVALHSALHEGMEANECCNKCLHGYDGRYDGRARTWDIATFLWRLGWRREK